MNKLVQKIMGGRDEMHPVRVKQARLAREFSLVEAKRIPGFNIRRLIATRMYGV